MDREVIDLHLKSRVIDLIDDLMYAMNDLDKKPNANKAERVKALSYSISVLYPCLPDEGKEQRENDEDKTKGLPTRSNRKNK